MLAQVRDNGQKLQSLPWCAPSPCTQSPQRNLAWTASLRCGSASKSPSARRACQDAHALQEVHRPARLWKVTTDDCRGFCDQLGREGSSKIGCVKHLDNIRGLFSAAVARAIIPRNPAAGIRPDGKIVKARRLPFTGAELTTILSKAQSTRFGGRRAADVLWALRLLVWTGARVSEIFQLRKADIGTEGGIPLIWIREGHPEQSVKTGNARKVPLAPAVAGFIDYAVAQHDEWIFGAFTRSSSKGRAMWLITSFPAFRRAHVTTDLSKTLHSIRHRFHDALDNAGIPIERQHVLVGHANSDVTASTAPGPTSGSFTRMSVLCGPSRIEAD